MFRVFQPAGAAYANVKRLRPLNVDQRLYLRDESSPLEAFAKPARRRRAQIERGQLTAANGLHVPPPQNPIEAALLAVGSTRITAPQHMPGTPLDSLPVEQATAEAIKREEQLAKRRERDRARRAAAKLARAEAVAEDRPGHAGFDPVDGGDNDCAP